VVYYRCLNKSLPRAHSDVTGLVDILNSKAFVTYFEKESSAVVGVKGDLLAPHKPKKERKRRPSRSRNSRPRPEEEDTKKRKTGPNSRLGGGQDEQKDTEDDEEEPKLGCDEEKQAGELLGRGRRQRKANVRDEFTYSESDGVSEVDEDESTEDEEADKDPEEIQLGPGMESVEEGEVEGGDDSDSDGF